ncbi:hypothetical protein [Parvimonas micra]
MNKITIQKVIKEEGSVIEFAFYATKDNGHQVEGVFSLEELKKIIEKVESLKSVEEETKDFINEKIKEDIKKDKSNLEKLKNLIERWKIGHPYNMGDLSKYNDIVFESLKNHTSDYENMPTIDENFWKIVPNNKPTEDGINPEWAENFDKAEFYSRDLSYPAGVYKKFYDELYKSKDKVPAGEVPSNISKYWTHIPKKISNLGI